MINNHVGKKEVWKMKIDSYRKLQITFRRKEELG
jgi:hypothetical protein